MSDVSSHLTVRPKALWHRRPAGGPHRRDGGATRVLKRALAYVVSLAIFSALIPSSCGRPNIGTEIAADASRLFPPPPQGTRVVALGNLRTSPAPDPVKGRLVRFLFGVEPTDPLGLIRPTDLTSSDDGILICDTALSGVFKLDPARGAIEPITLRERPNLPVAITQLPDGDRLVCDAAAGAVLRYDRLGQLRTRYSGPDDNFRPADAVQVGDALWVADALGH